jgi:predicted dehydrogenase
MIWKMAVIGAGMMGRNHVRVYADMPDIELVGIADANISTAETVARRFGVQAYANYLQLLDEQRPHAVTIAVPTEDHYQVALDAIERGIHVLIEKPIAFSIAQAQQIIAAADAADIRLMVGHIERFNPAVVALKERLAQGELGRVFEVTTRRQSPFPARVRDVGVVIDLAVHDLDVMRYISGAEVVRVFAETERRIHSTHEDLLSGVLRMNDGTVGTLTVNWLTPTKVRELYVTGERGMFRVDYLTQDLYFFENATARSGDWEALQVLRGVSEGQMIRHVVAKREPLQAELQAFLAAVRGEEPVAVSGNDGLRVLALAQSIVTSGQQHRVVSPEELL